MVFNDFEYDNILLSSFGFITCEMDNGGTKVVPNGASLNLTTYSTNFGRKKHKLGTSYEECIVPDKILICKNPNVYGYEDLKITTDELRTLTRWLNRSDYYKFQIIDNYEYLDFYYEATFNVSKVLVGDELVALELTMETNRPFAIGKKQTLTLKSTTDNWKESIYNPSDDEGYVYPKMEITINKAGTLDIFNELEQRHTVIKNCTVGEKITFEHPMCPTTTVPTHKIGNDFNWKFFRLASSYSNGRNDITVSLPCEIKLEYSPVVKVGI